MTQISQLYQETNEQSKLFNIGDKGVGQINIQTINRWITIAKRIVRSSKRRQRDDKQNKLTKYFILTTTKTSQLIQRNGDSSERKLLQLSINTFTITMTVFLSKRNNIVSLRFSPQQKNSSSILRKPMERKRILKSINKIGREISDQHQPLQARNSTIPEIPLIIS